MSKLGDFRETMEVEGTRGKKKRKKKKKKPKEGGRTMAHVDGDWNFGSGHLSGNTFG